MAPPVIYLDYNATTPCDPEVVEAMLPFLGHLFANPASRAHAPGREAFTALEQARRRVASVIGATSPAEVVFTSGATEAANLALLGLAASPSLRIRRLVTQATEHRAVLEPAGVLERRGWEVRVLGVDGSGRIRLEELEAALREGPALVSLMLANNETGVVQPVEEAVRLVHAAGGLIHCDAVQAPGRLPVDVAELGVDLLSLSGHKVYGPKGIGILWIRRRRPPLEPAPLLHGGGQERGLRAGTPNVPGAVGLATALEIASRDRVHSAARLGELRDLLETLLLAELDGVHIHGSGAPRLPNTTSIGLGGVDGNALLASLPGLAVSTGSACGSGSPEPSHVLRAMGVPARLAAASLRFSLGRPTSREEVEHAAALVVAEVRRLRR